MGLDISHMWFVLLSSPQGENYVCNILVMLLGFDLVFLSYALLHVYVGEDHIKAGTLHLDGKVVLYSQDLYYCPRLTPADPICCPTEVYLVVESSSYPKGELWTLWS